MWLQLFRLPLHKNIYQRFTKIKLRLHQTTGTVCLLVFHTHQQHDGLTLFFICISKNWYVWVGTQLQILAHDKQKQPPGIFISVAVWGNRWPWSMNKGNAGSNPNMGNTNVKSLNRMLWAPLLCFGIDSTSFSNAFIYFQGNPICQPVTVEHAVSAATPWCWIELRSGDSGSCSEWFTLFSFSSSLSATSLKREYHPEHIPPPSG